MTDASPLSPQSLMSAPPVELPRRALLKASEVCQIAQLQPYVLRSWEAEFPDLGVQPPTGGPRLYRRSDLARVLRLKQLLFVEGLTLAGARRRLEEEAGTVAPAESAEDPAGEALLLDSAVRARLAAVKAGLRSLLDLLSADGSRPGTGRAPRAAAPSAGGSEEGAGGAGARGRPDVPGARGIHSERRRAGRGQARRRRDVRRAAHRSGRR